MAYAEHTRCVRVMLKPNELHIRTLRVMHVDCGQTCDSLCTPPPLKLVFAKRKKVQLHKKKNAQNARDVDGPLNVLSTASVYELSRSTNKKKRKYIICSSARQAACVCRANTHTHKLHPVYIYFVYVTVSRARPQEMKSLGDPTQSDIAAQKREYITALACNVVKAMCRQSEEDAFFCGCFWCTRDRVTALKLIVRATGGDVGDFSIRVTFTYILGMHFRASLSADRSIPVTAAIHRDRKLMDHTLKKLVEGLEILRIRISHEMYIICATPENFWEFFFFHLMGHRAWPDFPKNVLFTHSFLDFGEYSSKNIDKITSIACVNTFWCEACEMSHSHSSLIRSRIHANLYKNK